MMNRGPPARPALPVGRHCTVNGVGVNTVHCNGGLIHGGLPWDWGCGCGVLWSTPVLDESFTAATAGSALALCRRKRKGLNAWGGLGLDDSGWVRVGLGARLSASDPARYEYNNTHTHRFKIVQLRAGVSADCGALLSLAFKQLW